MITELKINIKSLAAESKLIRAEERKTTGDKRRDLHLHRTGKLRNESRYAHLAYGYLRNRDYKLIENSTSKWIDEKRLSSKIKKFGGCAKKLKAWLGAE